MNRNVPRPDAEKISLLPTEYWSLADVRQYLADHRDNGAHCPACDQFVKVYRRKLYGTQARSLVYAERTFGDEWFHLSLLDGHADLGVRQADFPKLHYWRLIEPHINKPLWRLTVRGSLFVRDRGKVPSTVVLYDGKPLGFEGAMVSIRDVLPAKFDYQELMSA